MADPNETYRFNRKGMKPCCYQSLQYELYQRRGMNLMDQGDTLKCSECGAEMICEIGDSGKLRWGMR